VQSVSNNFLGGCGRGGGSVPCLALPSLVPLRPSSKALQKNQNKNNEKVDVNGLEENFEDGEKKLSKSYMDRESER